MFIVYGLYLIGYIMFFFGLFGAIGGAITGLSNGDASLMSGALGMGSIGPHPHRGGPHHEHRVHVPAVQPGWRTLRLNHTIETTRAAMDRRPPHGKDK